MATLGSADLCIKQEVFDEGQLHWVLQIVQNRKNPHNILWMVPHDDEHAAFDTAVYGVKNHGGTVVAVKTGGTRFNGPQDPNRNFNSENVRKCPRQVAASPEYTRRVLKWMHGERPIIIALHSNERGFSGDGQGGRGTISILRPLPGYRAFPARVPMPAMSPNDTMIFVASLVPKESDSYLGGLVDELNRSGVNVMYELVSPAHNDCSLSNYAALNKLRDYFNVEVVHGDSATQKRIVNKLVQILLHPQPVIAGKPLEPTPGPRLPGEAPGEPAKPMPGSTPTEGSPGTNVATADPAPGAPVAPPRQIALVPGAGLPPPPEPVYGSAAPNAAPPGAPTDPAPPPPANGAAPPSPNANTEPNPNTALNIPQPRPTNTNRSNLKEGFVLQLKGEYTQKKEAVAKKQEFVAKHRANLTAQQVAIRRVDLANGKIVFDLEVGPFATEMDVRGYCQRINRQNCDVRPAAP